jgi:hypothetical protein
MKTDKPVAKTQGESSVAVTVPAITDDVCSRMGDITSAKRLEVQAAVETLYLPRMKARLARGLITSEWHDRMIRGLINKLNELFDAFTPKGWREASKEERMVMMLTKTERKAYDRAKAAGSADPFRAALQYSTEQWRKRKAQQASSTSRHFTVRP